MELSERVFVGVLRLSLHIPGARSLKDRRQAVRSLRDRLIARQAVSCNEVGPSERPTQQTLVVTTAGLDAAAVRQVLQRCAADAQQRPDLLVAGLDVDVFRWHPGMQGADGGPGSEDG